MCLCAVGTGSGRAEMDLAYEDCGTVNGPVEPCSCTVPGRTQAVPQHAKRRCAAHALWPRRRHRRSSAPSVCCLIQDSTKNTIGQASEPNCSTSDVFMIRRRSHRLGAACVPAAGEPETPTKGTCGVLRPGNSNRSGADLAKNPRPRPGP